LAFESHYCVRRRVRAASQHLHASNRAFFEQPWQDEAECNLAAQSVSLAVSVLPYRKLPHAEANKRSPVAGVGLMPGSV
jgi:hypothetical protein